MAELNFQINIGGTETIAKTFGEVKKAIKDAEFQALALSQQFGETDDRVIALRKQIGALKDSIEDSAAATKNYAGSAAIFPAVAKSVQGIAAGFSAAQGAIGLFGGEAKNVEKALLKVQSAMALSQGLGDLIEAKDSFINLGSVIKGGVVNAFNALKTAIGATGIGLLVISLGLLVANFDKVKKAVLDFIPGLAKVGQFFGDLINAVTDFVGITSEAERQLEKLQKTTERGNEEIKNRIKVLQAQGGKEKEIYEESQKLVENDLNVLRKTLSAKGELTDEEQKKFRELQTEKEVLRLNETRRIEEENKKQAESNKKRNEEILKQNEEARLKALEAEQKRRDEVLDVEKQIRSIRQETELAGLSEREKRILAAQQELDNNLMLYQGNLDARQKAYILYEEQIKLAKAQTDLEESEAEAEKTTKFYGNLAERAAATMSAVTDELKLKQDAAEFDDKLQRAKTQTQIGLASETLNILGGLVDQNSIAGKAIAVSQAIINTYQGATKALAQGGMFGQVAAAAVIAQGLLSVKKIVSTKVPSAKGKGDVGGAGGSGGAGGVSSAAPMGPQAPQAATTNLSSSTINALGNQAIKAYVVETDVTTNQQRIKAIQQRARFD